ncbi:hypothetical protein JYB62_18625 [Algoriphagus lutimaris]|uniref:hypothetical protein n=1 Tax=Algoriphagus lutimaris TaxID=613197 RepID=UPI00196B5BD0|nr:hypothetical protein [Algoriphagus lutimaris]MBN3522026.1 hypothetical protein [Algoriphagus lutimaris]
MKRREFVQYGSVAFCAAPMLTSMVFRSRTKNETKPDWLQRLIKANDNQLDRQRGYRVSDSKSSAYGGFLDGAEIPNAHSTVAYIRTAGCALASSESRYYRSETVAKELEEAINYLLKIQHSDGTIDLLSTNFHSTPDTGFIVKWLVPVYNIVLREDDSRYATQLELLKTFLQRAGECLIVGGIHTPNHRWVVSGALTKLNEVWPNPRYVARIEEWLGEHIDMDPDGQYNEKSTLIYSPLTDRVLITIAKGAKKPELYEFVRRNLMMTTYYIHPNGEIATDASGRQDKAAVGTMEGYYYPYRFMALKDQNGIFSAICKEIEATVLEKSVSQLSYFLEDISLWRELPKPNSLPTSYAKAFPYSGLVRIRRGNWDATVISQNPTFLTFHSGNAVLQGIRFSASFFGKGQFQGGEIRQEGKDYVMEQKLAGSYYQPYPKDSIDPGGDWEKMPQSNREQSEIQYLTSTARIRENNDGVECDIEIVGTDNVPVSIELIFREGGEFKNVVILNAENDSYLLNTDEVGTYTQKGDTLTFGPGLAEHKGVQLRGGLPRMSAPTVYLTGFTPFKHTIRIS